MLCNPLRYEARRAARHAMRRHIVVRRENAKPNVAQLRDYSATGVGFTSNVELQPGQEFILNLVTEKGEQIPLKFTVVRCELAGREFTTGARRIDVEAWNQVTPIPVQHVEEPQAETIVESGQPEPQAAPEPTAAAEPEVAGPVRLSDTFPITQARGFARSKTIDGKTVCNWDRQLDLRREGDRIWLNMHPPGKTAGWGMFVDRAELIESIETLIDGDPGTMRLSA